MRHQCRLLSASRSSLYYVPVGLGDEELAIMRRIDELHLKYSFFGGRKITLTVKAKGTGINASARSG